MSVLNIVSNVAAANTLGGYANPVYGVSYSADGKVLATGSDDKTVKLWRLEDFDYLVEQGCNIMSG